MDSKHIERDYSAHAKSVIRPYDEYVKLEIFSFDPKHTKYYMGEDKSLVGLQNALQTSYRSWNCFKSEDKQNEMKFKIEYYPQEQGEEYHGVSVGPGVFAGQIISRQKQRQKYP